MAEADDKSVMKNRFGAFAVRMGYVTEKELEECAVEQHRVVRETGKAKRLGEILIDKGYMTNEQIREVLLAQQKVTGAHKVVGGFEVTAKIGVGGMGAVYKARQVSLDRPVALKILPPKFAEDEEFIGRFVREARAAAALNHPNIIQGIDVGYADGYHYFAMELVEGMSLSQRIKRDGPLAQQDALRIAEEMAGALQHAHSRGLVHRDIKPGNILIGKDGVAKLADLGLARRVVDNLHGSGVGKAVGTPYYISPEQARGESQIDIRADIYSLGATLYQAVTGQPPFDGPSPPVVLTKHLRDPVPSARDVKPDLSAPFSKMLMKMMAKTREERFQTPDELLEEIQRLRSGRPPKVRAGARAHDSRPTVRRDTTSSKTAAARAKGSPLPLVLVGATAAAILVAAGVLFLGTADSESPVPTPRDEAEPPAPEIEPAKVASASADRGTRVKEIFDYAADFAAKNGERYVESIKHFEEVMRQGKGTKYSLMAAEEIDNIKAARAKRADEVYAERSAAANALLARGEYGKAIAAAGTPVAELSGAGLDRRLQELKSKCEKAAADRWKVLAGKSAALFKQRKYDEAAKALAPVRSFGIPAYDQRLAASLQVIAARKKSAAEAAASRAAAEAKKDLDEILEAFWHHLGRREYDEAARKVGSMLRDPAKAAIGKQLERCRDDISLIRGLWAAVAESIKSQEGRRISLRVSGIRRSGTVRWVRDGNVGLSMRVGRGEMEAQLPLEKIDAADVVGHSGYEARDAKKRLALAVFLLAEGDVAGARKQLALAKRFGADIAPYEERLAVIDRGREEVAAEKAIAKLQTLVRQKKWPEAQAALKALKETYGSTDALAAAGADLAKAAEAIDDGLLEMGKVALFKDFSLPDVCFIDSRDGSDRADGKKWSTAWKSFSPIYQRNIPDQNGRLVVLLRGRGPGSPYIPPSWQDGRRGNGYIRYRKEEGGEVTVIGVDDTGEAVLACDQAFLEAAKWFNFIPAQVKSTVINIRIESFKWQLQNPGRGGNRWIGCRFFVEPEYPDNQPRGGIINLSPRQAYTPDMAGEESLVRDCLFARGRGLTTMGFAAARVEHCTFVGCQVRGFGEFWHPMEHRIDLSKVTVADCLFADMQTATVFHGRCTPAKFSNCYAARVKNVGDRRVAGQIKTIPDPGFNDPAKGDYSLSPRSPLRKRAADGTDVGYRPRECLKAAMDAVAKLQLEANRRRRR